MRHQISHRKFSRTSAHRKAMLRSLATSLFRDERFETTLEKAKDLKPIVEKLITLARKDTLANRRSAYAYLTNKSVVHKLFTDIAPRCTARKGGYTRVIRSGYRNGDAAQMAVIELVDKKEEAVKSSDSSKETAAA